MFLGDEESQAKTLAGLKSAEGFIRSKLAKTVNLRNTPEIRFVLDQSIEYGVKMSKMIDEVTKDIKSEDDAEEIRQTKSVYLGMEENMKSLDELFAGVKTAAIAGHIRPDGDCVGSCLATYNYITTYYPQIEVSLYLQPIPNIFKFMKNADKIISDCTADKEFDLFIAQDCGDLGRLGDAAKIF